VNHDDHSLARWLGETLFFDVEEGTRDDDAAGHILEEVYRRRDAENLRRVQHRRRRRWGTIAGITVVAASSAAAAIYLNDQPTRPESGATCRASVDVDADAIAIAAGVDPIAGCRQLWASDRFESTDGIVPPLAACISANGGIDVFPGDEGVCETLGLAPANPDLSAENEAIIALQDRLIMEINAAECRPVVDVVVTAEQILSESGLDGWRVVIEPGAENGICGKASLNSSTRAVTINEF